MEAGYKFETLATLPAPWGDTSREYIDNRIEEVVNNRAQYCSVVRTGIGPTVICIGGEVDAGTSPFLSRSLAHRALSGNTLTTRTQSLGLEALEARRSHELG